MKSQDKEFLEGGSYISFATKKHSGDWVTTPVWFAPDENNYYLFSAGNAGKVKRLRNNSAIEVAPCDQKGKLLGTPVTRGDSLFKVAPLQDYRIVLQVDEQDIAPIQSGQKGVLVLRVVQPTLKFQLEQMKGKLLQNFRRELGEGVVKVIILRI